MLGAGRRYHVNHIEAHTKCDPRRESIIHTGPENDGPGSVDHVAESCGCILPRRRGDGAHD